MKKLATPQSVGIDVAKAKIDVAILWDMSETKNKQFQNQTEDDMKKLVSWLEENGVNKDTPIIVESTGSYHWLSCLLLSEAGFLVHLINPLITKRYERSSIRGAKSDTVDAKRLAEIGIIEKELPLFFDSRESLSAKKYHSLYAKIQKVKQQLERSYKDALESAEIVGISLNLNSIKDCLDQIDIALQILKKIIEENISNTAKELAEIKGISKFQASVLCNAVEGRTFENKNQLIAFFGLDIQIKQSGTWKGKEKLSKRGNSFYRMILFQLGWSLSRNNEQFREYYQRLRNQGKHYYTCLIATARKFLKFFFVYYLNQNNIPQKEDLN
jgi:transposase